MRRRRAANVPSEAPERGRCAPGGRAVRLDRLGRVALARALPDTPETFGSISCLSRDLCEAYVAGDLPRYAAVVLQERASPGELMSHGSDPNLLWELIEPLQGWYAVSVVPRAARPLGRLIETHLRTPVRYYQDRYHVMDRPAPEIGHPAVRRMTPADLRLLAAAPPQLRPRALGTVKAALTEGVVACAVVGGEVVSRAYTAALSPGYADIAIDTLDGWRGQGFATATAAVVAGEVQAMGRVPVWSAGEGNRASLRVAEKLGFTEVLRRFYVILAGAPQG